jgi:hypothetical protein
MKVCVGYVIVATTCFCSASFAADDVFLLSYFKGNGETGVYLAAGEDGLTFKDLNEGRPVFAPPQWAGQNLTRDPSIVYRDGLFHMVWTSSWTGECFGAATSPDLKAWSQPVQVQPFRNWPANDRPINTWAPEVHWDPVQKNYAIIWSSATAAVEGDGGHNSGGLEKDPARKIRPDPRHHRTFISRTADFQTFADAQVFFSPGVSEIDAMMAFDDRGRSDPADDCWVLVCKDEQMAELGGKNIRVTTAPADLTKPFPPQFRAPDAWQRREDPKREGSRLEVENKGKMPSPLPWSGPAAGPGSSVQASQWAEGPTLLKVDGEWRLYFDRFRLRANRFGLATSKDLIHWTDKTSDLTVPPQAMHGTIFRAPRSLVVQAFPMPRAGL